jgi:SAM-dependent methyltransferase
MVTVGRRAYDLLYRFGAPWEGGDRVELRALVADGRCSPETLRRPGAEHARAVDLGCGSGAVSIELAEAGFEVTGVDFSEVALRKARAAAQRRRIAPGRLAFVRGDLTKRPVPGITGLFDLLVDYGTLDDLPAQQRPAMANLIARLARPGARFFLFAFSARPADLPRFSFGGPSRAFPGLVPGEVEALFGAAFGIEVLQAPTRTRHIATYLLERRSTDVGALPKMEVLMSATRNAAPDAAIARSASFALYAGAIAAIGGIAFLAAMFASFSAGAQAEGERYGAINDVLVIAQYALMVPAIVAIRRLSRDRWPGLSTGIAVSGLALVVAVAILQGLLVAGVLTFDQQIGPMSIMFLVLAGWFVAVGWLVNNLGIARHGIAMGLLASTYVGYPVWTVWLARALRDCAAIAGSGLTAELPAG